MIVGLHASYTHASWRAARQVASKLFYAKKNIVDYLESYY